MRCPVNLVFFLILGVTRVLGQGQQFECEGEGFYPHPASCSQFYRCTDLWGVGQYQQHLFMCPEGTVWDSSIYVCNWPEMVPGCGGPEVSPTTSTTTTETTASPTTTDATTVSSTATTISTTSTAAVETTTLSGVDEDPTYRPSEDSVYQCEKPGVFDDEENCNKFWLCKEEVEGEGILEALLYRCPPGYLFSSSILRCKKEEDITCVDRIESRNIQTFQLTEDMLESFFAKWSP